jgi:hypothetical protein
VVVLLVGGGPEGGEGKTADESYLAYYDVFGLGVADCVVEDVDYY